MKKVTLYKKLLKENRKKFEHRFSIQTKDCFFNKRPEYKDTDVNRNIFIQTSIEDLLIAHFNKTSKSEKDLPEIIMIRDTDIQDNLDLDLIRRVQENIPIIVIDINIDKIKNNRD